MKTIDFYISQSEISDPGKFIQLYKNLPTSIEDLCKVVQGLIAHRDGAKEFYGFEVPEDKKREADLRYVEKIIGRVMALINSPLSTERPPEKRVFGSCRDFAILLCSILRYQKVPARLRCGFSAYFEEGDYIDHWVCEYWGRNEQKWLLVDAELGDEVLRIYKIDFNPTSVPRDKFLVAGQAWQLFRQGKVNPESFGVPWLNIKGAWFIRGNLLRDLAALNKVELLPWDYTEFSDKQFGNLSELSRQEVKLLDKISELTTSLRNEDIFKIQSLYNSDPRLKVASRIKSYTIHGPKEIVLVK